MGTQQRVASLVLSQLALGAVQANDESASNFLSRQLSDPRSGLLRALQRSQENAWRALEIALAGHSFLDRCKALLPGADYRAVEVLVGRFLGTLPQGWAGSASATVRERALQELRAARRAGVLEWGTPDPGEFTAQATQLARLDDPAAELEAEHRATATLADELTEQSYLVLARIIIPRQGPPFLGVAARYFFRLQAESDAALSRGLTWVPRVELTQVQEQGLAGLAQILTQYGKEVERALEVVREAVGPALIEALDVLQEARRHGRAVQTLAQAVLGVLGPRQLDRREVRAADSASVANDGERQHILKLVSHFRALPQAQRRQMPALLNALGKLQILAGDFEGAGCDFQEAAGLLGDGRARAEVHHNAYRAALECHDWTGALRELISAARLDARRFAPFPMGKYQPQGILGAGSLGVAFLCKHTFSTGPVRVQTLPTEGLDRGIGVLFTEMRALQQLDHPSIGRIHECDFTDPIGKSRPFVAMEYFDGVTLEDYVAKNGPLPAADVMALADCMAEALEAAHAQGVLHRSLKPSSLLLRKDPRSAGPPWKMRVIDFGLVPGQDRALANLGARSSVLGAALAGMRDYAAPEQTGPLPGQQVGPPTDIYGFARTCCFALFGTPQPLPRHWTPLPIALTRLLKDCLQEDPQQRPRTFTALRKRLAGVAATGSGAVIPVDLAPPPTVEEPAAAPLPAASAVHRPQRLPGRRLANDDYHQASRQRMLWGAVGIVVALVLILGLPLLLLPLLDRQTPQTAPALAQRPPSFTPDPAPPGQEPPAEPPDQAELPPPPVGKDSTPPRPDRPLREQPTRAANRPRPKVLPAEEAAGQSVADLQNPSATRRRAALLRLTRLRGVVECDGVASAAAKLLKDTDKGVRLAAAATVGAWGGPESVAPLARLLKDPDKAIRLAAIAALGRLKTQEAVEPLLDHLLTDSQPCLEALRDLGPLAEPAAMARLRDRDRAMRLEACKALICVATARSGPDLKAFARDVRDRELREIAQAVLRHDQAVMVAVAKLTGTSPAGQFDRIEGAKMLATLAPNARRAQVAELLVRQLALADAALGQEIPKALATWGTPDVVPSLIQVLKQDDPASHLSEAAMTALGHLKDPRAVYAIVPRLTKQGAVDPPAQKALVSLGEVAEWPLQKYLNDPDPAIRIAVCEILGQIGTEDSLPALEALIEDDDSPVGEAASQALQAIRRRVP